MQKKGGLGRCPGIAMICVKVICVGKLKEGYLREAVAEYAKRMSAFCKLDIIEVPEYKLPQNPSLAQEEKGMQQESDSILQKKKGFLIPLCIEGDMLSSQELAAKLSSIAVSGQSDITFVLGSSCGLSDSIKKQADLKLSISKMTFPHQLARVMLLEQLYRAFQINCGGKYHK